MEKKEGGGTAAGLLRDNHDRQRLERLELRQADKACKKYLRTSESAVI